MSMTIAQKNETADFKLPVDGSSSALLDRVALASSLGDIAAKVFRGERLTAEDGLRMFNSPELTVIGHLADVFNRRLNGDIVYFTQNHYINYTNVCIYKCKFCAFRRSGHEDDAYTMDIPEFIHHVENTYTDRTAELHIVGGLQPELPFQYYLDMMSETKKKFPTISIKAFTAVEIDYFSRIAGLSLEETLRQLKEAGLDTMPGGGAEVFSERVRQRMFADKMGHEQYIKIHRIAHQIGIRSNATMLYGHIETLEERVQHLVMLRDLQDEAPGFHAFIPLAYHVRNKQLGDSTFTTGIEDLRTLAISRLMLDNFPHVKAYWIMLTPHLSQIALAMGASDFDGTIVEERVFHDAGARTEMGLTRADIVHFIRAAGKKPVERNARYEILESMN